MNLFPTKKQAAGKGGSLAMFNPAASLVQMRQDFDKLFNRYFGGSVFPFTEADLELNWGGVDLDENDSAYVVKFEAPGFDPKEINLQLRGNQLVLEAEHKAESKGKEGTEKRESTLYRRITLPDGFLADKCEAAFQNGLLTVTVPKSEAGKSRRITIKSA
jgi:HSP20 family protein